MWPVPFARAFSEEMHSACLMSIFVLGQTRRIFLLFFFSFLSELCCLLLNRAMNRRYIMYNLFMVGMDQKSKVLYININFFSIFLFFSPSVFDGSVSSHLVSAV